MFPYGAVATSSTIKNDKRSFQHAFPKNFETRHVLNRLPAGFIEDEQAKPWSIRSSLTVSVSRATNPTGRDLKNLADLHKRIRSDLHYINAAETLWYVKTTPKGTKRLARQSPTLTLAAMHRLSELCRYRPRELDIHLSGGRNWLISEFIQMSAGQFFDQIVSEITGHQFLAPNVRPAT